MANKKKIDETIGLKIIELSNQGHNCRSISLQIGVARDTVKKYCVDNGITINIRKRVDADKESRIIQFIEYIKVAKTLKDAQRKYQIGYDQAVELAKQNGCDHLIRSRSDSAKDKILSRDEVIKRLPDHSEYLGFEDGVYKFRCIIADKVFYKKASKIQQGSPFGKSGYIQSEDDYKQKLKLIGYTIKPGSFKGTKKPATVYCSRGHERHLTKAALVFRLGCPVCGNNGTSTQEQSIFSIVKEIDPDTRKYSFIGSYGKGYRDIDVYSPKHKVGFEFCGLYWHTEDAPFPRTEESHYKKYKAALDDGIRLFTIFEDEWKDRQNIVIGHIKSSLGCIDSQVGARDCSIRQVDPSVGYVFCDENHIQGSARSSLVCFGLYYDEVLVGVMSGGHHHRYNDNTVLVLDRLCFRVGWQIQGGASKLFKYLYQWAKDNQYKKIISWSDNRHSNGDVYKVLGFKFDADLSPDYSYVKGTSRYSKHSLKKTKDEILSGEKELALRKEQGYHRIWDCGKKRWIYELS